MKQLFIFLFSCIALITQAQYKIGDTAIDFNLKNVDGKNISLQNFKDAKGYIVIFTCNHCPFSKMYEKRILELDKLYKSKGFPVLAINSNDAVKVPDDSFEEMVKLAKKQKYTFPYLHDETQEIAKAYGATRTPHVFVLDKNFKVQYIGAIDNDAENEKKDKTNYVQNAVNNLLKGKQPEVTETKAIGCTIKWK